MGKGDDLTNLLDPSGPAWPVTGVLLLLLLGLRDE